MTIIIGSGIFQIPSLVAQNVQSVAQYVLVWIVAALISASGALTYVVLAKRYAVNGGEAVYLSRALWSPLGSLFLWAECLIIRPGALYLLVETAAKNLLYLWSTPGEATYLVLLLFLVCAVQWLPLAANTELARKSSIFKIIALSITAALCFFGLNVITPPAAVETNIASGNIGVAVALALFVYGGWSDVALIVDDLRNGSATYRRGVLLGIGVVSLLYVGLALGLVRILGLHGVAIAQSPVVDAAHLILGATGSEFVALCIAVCSLGAAHAVCFTGVRLHERLVHQVVSRRGVIPMLDQTKRRFAVAIQMLIAFAVAAASKNSRQVLLYTTPVVWGFAILVCVASAVTFRRERLGIIARPRLTPSDFLLSVLPILVYAGASMWVFYSALVYDLWASAMAASIVLVGFVVILVVQRQFSTCADNQPMEE